MGFLKIAQMCIRDSGYTYAHAAFAGAELSEEAFLKYGHENITIRDNYVKRSGGDAITVMYALRPVVEHNCSDLSLIHI